jgi:hypothetical protein
LTHFTTKRAFLRHEKESCSRRKRIRSTTTYITCATCDIQIPATTLHSHRKSAQHKNKSLKKLEEDGVHQIATAFESNVISYRITGERTCVDLNEFIEEIREKMINLIQENVEKHTTVKLNLELFGLYTLESQNLFDVKSFNTRNIIITLGSNWSNIIEDFKGVIENKMSEFLEKDSGK